MFAILSILIGISGASISKLLDFSFNEKNIFDFYYLWLLDIKEKFPKLTKPLGLCIICMCFWVCLFIFLAIKSVTGLPLIYLLISEGITYYIIFKEYGFK